jgi:hypothetical protein
MFTVPAFTNAKKFPKKMANMIKENASFSPIVCFIFTSPRD